MLSAAIRGSVEEGGALDPKKREDAEQVDRLLVSLAQRSKEKRTNRESRAVFANLFDINKLRAIRDIFVQKNRSDRFDNDLSINAEEFKEALSPFIKQREVVLHIFTYSVLFNPRF